MQKCIADGFEFAVTIAYHTGGIERICFYAFNVLNEVLPRMQIGSRLESFAVHMPCYHTEQVINFGWSYANGGKAYLEMDKSCCGSLANLMKYWGSISL